MRVKTFVFGAAAALCVMVVTYAQPPTSQPATQILPKQAIPKQGSPEQSRPHSNSAAQVPTKDQMLASCLALDNQEDVIIAKMAEGKAKNDEVKAFAAMIAAEHQECVEKLAKIAPQILLAGDLRTSKLLFDSTSGTGSETSSVANTEKNSLAPTSTSPMHPNGTSLNIVQLHRELTQQCLIDTKELLSEKSGGDFDRCYIGLQLAKHSAMKTKLTVFERHTTGKLKNIVSDGLETTKKHLAVAEKLMARLATSDGTESSRK